MRAAGLLNDMLELYMKGNSGQINHLTVHLPFRSSISLYFGKDPITVLNRSSHWQAKTVALWYRQYLEKDNGNCCYCTTISWHSYA
jgi:hypothetical protein